MNQPHADAPNALPVTITYRNQDFLFFPVNETDHIGQQLKKTRAFYESDVLETIRERTHKRQGTAIDASAFIGTHSIFFRNFVSAI